MSISKAEESFLRTSILSTPPSRADGRLLNEFRMIAVNREAVFGRVNLGGTDVIAAVKLEVENIGPTGDGAEGEGRDGGRVACAIICAQSAYPHKSPQALDEASADLTALFTPILASSLTPSSQLTIVPHKRSWLLGIEAIILADDGNAIDAVMVAIRAALWDLRIPRTKGVQYVSRPTYSGTYTASADAIKGILTEGKRVDPADFELEDSYDEGNPLERRDELPVCVTLNLIGSTYFLDASAREADGVQDRLSLFYSFSKSASLNGVSHGMHYSGPSELKFGDVGPLIQSGEKHASELSAALNSMFRAEDVKNAAALRR
ncbi:ribosomal protein S5 domain 2-type protein [Cantharellus anzutake]|uniref:ribosomal protein S5 domain 2-type protein n=1 Tax=Cantharellus anzutake TaxID=1750568 RepID=UPI0019054E76|nr:ribosomal protein S5 domain 2-type protein [Cantharellus anzutake]KAF8342681.1 ribosomal protein S5 domain 2-type protein [Cantharellus anzutake]